VTGPAVRFRDAQPSDEGTIARFVRALAEYERLSHEAVATDDDFRRALFGTPPRAYALIIEDAGEPIGFAVWFYKFSTFAGRPGLYLEDIFVVPERRGQGIGRAVFRHLARRAVADGCVWMEWAVLDWNTPAIEFYGSIGARTWDGWIVKQLTGKALAALAA
jgi:GNAT superfamily N-acetyltransferase